MQLTKQKTKLIALTILVVIFAMIAIAMPTANAQSLNYDDFDTVFLETAKELCSANTTEIQLTAQKEPLFDISLNMLGYVYDFTYNEQFGYAIVIWLNDQPQVTEFVIDSPSPYEEVTGNKIYVKFLTHLYENEGDFFLIDQNIKLTEEDIQLLSTIGYRGMGDITYSEERITYTSKSENKERLAFSHPAVTEVGGLSNACAPIAGANLIQYWDRFNENLIPNFTSYTLTLGQIMYKPMTTNIENIVRDLYTDMGTNSNGSGTTLTQFKNGLSTYCNEHGYSISYNTCMSNEQFSYSLAKQCIEAGQPLALFVDTFTIADITSSETDLISYLHGNGSHIMAGFGYNEITYTFSNGSTRTDYYIAVASGYTTYSRAFYNINMNTIIDNVFGVVIT